MRSPYLAALALALVACSSNSSTTPTQPPANPVTVTISSLDSLDGRMSGVGNRGVIVYATGATAGIYVGQTSASPSLFTFVAGNSRGFARFLLNGVPSGSTIVSATLKLQQVDAGFNATPDPYPSFGNIVAEHVDFGAAIDSLDFATAALDSPAPVLSTNYTKELKSVDVTAQVQADVTARRSSSDFRFRFATETLPADQNSTRGTYFGETSGLISNSGPAPQLVVTYR